LIRANKKLGQHFLTNEGVVARIADQVEGLAQGSRIAIEIGPGPGALTRALLARKLQVHAVELDPRMIEHLKTQHAGEIASGQLTLHHADALKIDLAELPTQPSVVCGNLPYNVGTAIVFRFLEEFPQADRFCYMLQKEVVLRLISESGGPDYGLAGVKLAWSTRVGGHFWVKPGSFTPPPKVDSGVFWFERLAKEFLLADPLTRGSTYDQGALVVAKLFQHRRKMLRATIRELAPTPFAQCRPQELDPKTLLELALSLNNDHNAPTKAQ
jgi:16S rRNA (adenine1518-N6/adenine1519-N6)-dimethyltransferase